ncbi:halo-CC-star protein HcsS [Halostella litorea]|uniref:halo-CC-star protein HcsS n=1 Tax=Halostella litorea TaxID=2528831 RepID=UPI00192A6167|nr:halo-CC-star protein HcsS [Halostella litorea]
MLLSADADDVLAAAESLGDALRAAKAEESAEAFESTVRECNEAITEATGVEYGEACDAGSDCC